MKDAGESTCPICKRRWTVVPHDDCLVPSCGCFSNDASRDNPDRPCEACGIQHALTCNKMPKSVRDITQRVGHIDCYCCSGKGEVESNDNVLGAEPCLTCNGSGVASPDVFGEDECRHERRFELKGVLTCQDCAATYDETTLEWVAV